MKAKRLTERFNELPDRYMQAEFKIAKSFFVEYYFVKNFKMVEMVKNRKLLEFLIVEVSNIFWLLLM